MEQEGRSDVPCCICGSQDWVGANEFIKCSKCKIIVHQDCYGVPRSDLAHETYPRNWLCNRCVSFCQVRASKLKCSYCPMKEGAFKTLEGFNTMKFVHVICALLNPGLEVEPDTVVIRNETLSSKDLNKFSCFLCQENARFDGASTGYCIPCAHSGCDKRFHAECGQLAGTLSRRTDEFGIAHYIGHCKNHRPGAKPKAKSKTATEKPSKKKSLTSLQSSSSSLSSSLHEPDSKKKKLPESTAEKKTAPQSEKKPKKKKKPKESKPSSKEHPQVPEEKMKEPNMKQPIKKRKMSDIDATGDLDNDKASKKSVKRKSKPQLTKQESSSDLNTSSPAKDKEDKETEEKRKSTSVKASFSAPAISKYKTALSVLPGAGAVEPFVKLQAGELAVVLDEMIGEQADHVGLLLKTEKLLDENDRLVDRAEMLMEKKTVLSKQLDGMSEYIPKKLVELQKAPTTAMSTALDDAMLMTLSAVSGQMVHRLQLPDVRQKVVEAMDTNYNAEDRIAVIRDVLKPA